MISKNLRYYRLKNGLTMKDLAENSGLSPKNVSCYEKNERRPSIDDLKRIAVVLGVGVADFLSVRDERLAFVHGEFRKTSRFRSTRQDFVREAVEDYFSRFFEVVKILGDEVLPPAPTPQVLDSTEDFEADGKELRRLLNFATEGAIVNLISSLENKGFLIFELETEESFSGMNGSVDEYPYIVVNKNQPTERKRSTIAHELAHWAFKPSSTFDERYATAVSGSFFLPREDILRELGSKRTTLGNDAKLVCHKYGVSIQLLAKRANQTGILDEQHYRSFCIQMNQRTKNESNFLDDERPELFEQLICRAVNEGEINLSKASELLRISYAEAANLCLFDLQESK